MVDPPMQTNPESKEFRWEDAKRLCADLWSNEVELNKKRRWLMGLPLTCDSDYNKKKKRKAPKFLLESDRYLPESYIREKNDVLHIKDKLMIIQKGYGTSTCGQNSYHVVQDYRQLFDKYKLERECSKLLQFAKTFTSIIDDLNDNALSHVASLVAPNKVTFENKRSKMKRIIEAHIADALMKSDCKNCSRLLEQLEEIFRKPLSFRKEQLTLHTPLSSSLLSAVHQQLERLGGLPSRTLAAMQNKLSGKNFILRFPPQPPKESKDNLVGMIKRKGSKLILNLKEGMDLPQPLAKALSIMNLSLKVETRHANILASEFFPFPSEVVNLQNEILRALWSLQDHKFKYRKLKELRPDFSLKGDKSVRSFRTNLKNYLVQYLFGCDEIAMPKEVLSTLHFINGSYMPQDCIYSKDMLDEETEAVLNVSARLKQAVLNLLPESKIKEESESSSLELLESDDDSEKDFEIKGDNYCAYPVKSKCQSLHETKTEEVETTGTSKLSDFTDFTQPLNASIPTGIIPLNNLVMFPKSDVDGDTDSLDSGSMQSNRVHCSMQSNRVHSQSHMQLIQDICDEASFLSYTVIDNLLKKFIQNDDQNVDVLTELCLIDDTSPPDIPEVPAGAGKAAMFQRVRKVWK